MCQQVDRDTPRIVEYLKTDAGYREVDLSKEVAEYLRAFISGKEGLLFQTRNGTPYLYNNLEQRWLTPRLRAMGIDEKGMGFHAFRRFRKTWLRGKRVQEDINHFWMGPPAGNDVGNLFPVGFGTGPASCGSGGRTVLPLLQAKKWRRTGTRISRARAVESME